MNPTYMTHQNLIEDLVINYRVVGRCATNSNTDLLKKPVFMITYTDSVICHTQLNTASKNLIYQNRFTYTGSN